MCDDWTDVRILDNFVRSEDLRLAIVVVVLSRRLVCALLLLFVDWMRRRGRSLWWFLVKKASESHKSLDGFKNVRPTATEVSDSSKL